AVNSLAGNDVLRVRNFGGASSLKTVSLHAGGEVGDTLVIEATAADDRIVYTPTSSAGGTLASDSSPAVFTFLLSPVATSTFTVVGLGNDANELVIVGTNGDDVITVASLARTLTVLATQNPFGAAFKPVVLDLSVETATVQGRLGGDTFFVVPARRQPFALPDVP